MDNTGSTPFTGHIAPAGDKNNIDISNMSHMHRRKCRTVKAGGILIGGDAPISVQSMTNVRADDVYRLTEQVAGLVAAGCDIVRVSVPDADAVKALHELKSKFPTLPVVADIHFDYKMAIESVNAGADKLRINPGNIGGNDRVKAVADTCRVAGVPIRIGVNSGSLEKSILARYGSPTAEALAESALFHVSLLEKFDFGDIVISAKASNVRDTVIANEILAEKCDYPLHIGVTEAGTPYDGIIISSAGIGSLLLRGIGDTVRVSLTAEPVEEVKAGIALLKALGIRKTGVRLISCPTCGRTRTNLINIAGKFRELVPEIEKRYPDVSMTVAIMGCAVNGPGEAVCADIGVACGKSEGLLFFRGKTAYSVPEEKIAETLLDESMKLAAIKDAGGKPE